MSSYENHSEYCVHLHLVRDPSATFVVVVTAADAAGARRESEKIVSMLNGLVSVERIEERLSRADC